MVYSIASWYKRKYILSINYLDAALIGIILCFGIFVPIIIGIQITNSNYEKEHNAFMQRYKSSFRVFPIKSENEDMHDAICPQLNEAGHNYKDCKIWNKKSNY